MVRRKPKRKPRKHNRSAVQQQPQHGQPPVTPPAPALLQNPIPTEQTGAGGNAAKNEDQRKITIVEPFGRWHLLFAGVLTIATVWQVFAMIEQNAAVDEQGRDTDKANEVAAAAAKAAQNAADAAKRSNEIAGDTAAKQLRAYVMIMPGSALYHSPADGSYTVSLQVKNAGQTPAHKTAMRVAPVYGSAGYKGPFDLSLLGNSSEEITIAPGHQVEFKPGVPPLRPDLAAVANEKKLEILIFGKITYIDAFGKSRFVDFRFRRGQLVAPNVYQLEFQAEGNNSD